MCRRPVGPDLPSFSPLPPTLSGTPAMVLILMPDLGCSIFSYSCTCNPQVACYTLLHAARRRFSIFSGADSVPPAGERPNVYTSLLHNLTSDGEDAPMRRAASRPARSRSVRPAPFVEALETRATISDSFLSALVVPALSTAALGHLADTMPPPPSCPS